MLSNTEHRSELSEDSRTGGTALRRAVTRLYSRFRSERLDGEVPDAALLVLLALDKQGPLSLTALADAAKVTLGSMSQTVKRLDEHGLVTRTRGVEDRRTVVFALTEHGTAAVAASRQHRRDWLNSRLASLTPEERDDIARVLTTR